MSLFSVKNIVFFCLFGICKMVHIMDIYNLLNISIGKAMKNPKMLKFVPDHLKTKKKCKHAVKKLPYLLKVQ